MKNFIEEYPNAASDDYCDRMIQQWDFIHKTGSNFQMFKGEETVSGGLQSRKDEAYFFEFDGIQLLPETSKILDNCLEQYLDKYPSLAQNQIYSNSVKVQRTKPSGGYHIWHMEKDFGPASRRILTWTIYLNDIPEGEGETEFLEYGVRVKPKKGTVCLFPTDWMHTHRGNPVYSCDKYIATGWYHVS